MECLDEKSLTGVVMSKLRANRVALVVNILSLLLLIPTIAHLPVRDA